MLQSINQLAELTGKDRRTITQRLAEIPHEKGPKSAHLYESTIALAAIFDAGRDGISLDEARKRMALSQERLNNSRGEVLRKERIPIEIPIAENEKVTQAVASTLKAAKGKVLTEALINSLLAKFRAIPEKLKW